MISNMNEEAFMQKLAEQKRQGYLTDSHQVKEVIGEYVIVQKQLFRFKNEKEFMLL